MSLKTDIINVIKNGAIYTTQIIHEVLSLNYKYSRESIRQSIKRLRIKGEITRISSFKINNGFVYCLHGDEKDSWKSFLKKSRNSIKNRDLRLVSAIFSNFNQGIISISSVYKILGGTNDHKNETAIEIISDYFKDKDDFKQIIFEDVIFYVHKSNFSNFKTKELKKGIKSKLGDYKEKIILNNKYKAEIIKWAEKSNIIAWKKGKYPGRINRLIQYQKEFFDGSGPSYLNAYFSKSHKFFPIVFDVLTYRRYEDYDAEGFIYRINSIDYSNKNMNTLGIVFCRSYSQKAQRSLKEKGTIILNFEAIYGKSLPKLLKFSTGKYEKIDNIPFEELRKNILRYSALKIDDELIALQSMLNNLKGTLFEFIVAHIFAIDKNNTVSLDSAQKMGLDIKIDNNNTNTSWLIECKAYTNSKRSMENLYNQAIVFMKKIYEIRSNQEDNNNKNFIACFICLNTNDEIINLIENSESINFKVEGNVKHYRNTEYFVWDKKKMFDYFSKFSSKLKTIKEYVNLLEYS